MRRTRGITLLEILVTATITIIILLGAVQAMAMGLQYNEHLRSGRTIEENRRAFEEKLTVLLTRIYIDPVNTTSASTYFVGQTGEGMPPGQTIIPGQMLIPGQTTQAPAAGAATTGTSTAAGSGDADTLMFTVMGRSVPGSVLASDPTDDFETDNTSFGPQGGIAEYAVSTTPVGDSQGKSGVVIREQVPADQDATQGGTESIIEPDITKISFEFFDGTQWQSTWNTFAQTTRQLPAAIRVSYTMPNEDQDRVFIVGLAYSTVTPNNPATTTGGTS
jgi:hypothetical protein